MGHTKVDKRSDKIKVIDALGGSQDLIRLIGDSTNDTDYAVKEAVAGECVRISTQEADRWLEEDGWIGLMLDNDVVAVDVDDKSIGRIVFKRLKDAGLKFVGIRTQRGYQFIFRSGTHILSQKSKVMALGGFKVDYRVGGQDYIVLPTCLHDNELISSPSDDELSVMPLMFLPASLIKNNIADVISAALPSSIVLSLVVKGIGNRHRIEIECFENAD